MDKLRWVPGVLAVAVGIGACTGQQHLAGLPGAAVPGAAVLLIGTAAARHPGHRWAVRTLWTAAGLCLISSCWVLLDLCQLVLRGTVTDRDGHADWLPFAERLGLVLAGALFVAAAGPAVRGRAASPLPASRRVRFIGYAGCLAWLPYAGLHILAALGVPGIEPDGYQPRADSAIALAIGVGLAVFLLLGLVSPWGLVFPRWAPPLTGRRVPRLLPIVPVWLIAPTFIVYGLGSGVLALLITFGVVTWHGSVGLIGYGEPISFAGYGLALAVAAVSYRRRTGPAPSSPRVYDAVRTRQSIRRFTPLPVPRAVLDRVLTAAGNAPSGSNLQPWHVYVVSGEPLTRLKTAVAARIAAGDPGDEPEFAVYPAELRSPYLERLRTLGETRYGSLGIARDDVAARTRVRAENWNCFGAGIALFCYLDRDMPAPRWADAGIYLQTVMLLLRAEGLDSCTQEAWAEYHRSVAEVLSPPPGRMLFCGMSIGYADPSVEHPRIPRAPLPETVTFLF